MPALCAHLIHSLVGPEAARLFEQGVGLQVGQVGGTQYDDFGDLAITDVTLAKVLVAETKKIDARLGGLYQGRLDHLRSMYRDVFCIGMYWDVSGCIGMYFVSRIVWVSLY